MKNGFFKSVMELVLDITATKGEVPQKVKESLGKKYPEIPLEKLSEIVDNFLELLQENSNQEAIFSMEKIREEEIQHFVANTIQKHFQLSEIVSENLAFYLLNKDDPDPEIRRKLTKRSISSNDLNLIEHDLIGIDVIYERLSASKWACITRIFIRSANKTIRYESTVELPPDSLPSVIRHTFYEEREEKQRFILYPLKEK